MSTTKTSKVKVKLTGQDGNVFSIIGKVSRALKDAGMADKAREYSDRCFAAHSYDEVLRISMEFVDVR